MLEMDVNIPELGLSFGFMMVSAIRILSRSLKVLGCLKTSILYINDKQCNGYRWSDHLQAAQAGFFAGTVVKSPETWSFPSMLGFSIYWWCRWFAAKIRYSRERFVFFRNCWRWSAIWLHQPGYAGWNWSPSAKDGDGHPRSCDWSSAVSLFHADLRR